GTTYATPTRPVKTPCSVTTVAMISTAERGRRGSLGAVFRQSDHPKAVPRPCRSTAICQAMLKQQKENPRGTKRYTTRAGTSAQGDHAPPSPGTGQTT